MLKRHTTKQPLPLFEPLMQPRAQAYLQPMGTSPLSHSSKQGRAHSLAQRLINDRTLGSTSAPPEILHSLTLGIAQAQADGRNPRTLAKDNLAWRHFQEYAERLGFDPHLCTAWTKKFPERETVKLAGSSSIPLSKCRHARDNSKSPSP